MSTDDYGTEYIYPPAKWGESPILHERICAQDERFASVNEAIGLLQYGQQQTDDLADQRHNDHERRIAMLEAAQPVPAISRWHSAPHVPEGDWAHIPSSVWEDICAELEALRQFKAGVPWKALATAVSDLYKADLTAISHDNNEVIENWIIFNAPKEAAE